MLQHTIESLLLQRESLATIARFALQNDIALITLRLHMHGQKPPADIAWKPVIPNARSSIALAADEYVALIPAAKLEASIDALLDEFYASPLAQTYPDAILSFGTAVGPSPSAQLMIEAAAQDLVERSDSQGTPLLASPLLLELIPGWKPLYTRANYARARLAELATLDPDRDAREQMRKLTARFRHDLVGNLLRIRAMADAESGEHSESIDSAVVACLETLETMKQAVELHISVEKNRMIVSFAELQAEVEQLEHQLDKHEQLLEQRRSLDDQNIALDRARELLLPFVIQLSGHILTLVRQVQTLHLPIEAATSLRIARTAQFCALLTQNLARVVQGQAASRTEVDIHKAIKDVCNMLTPLLEERTLRYALSDLAPMVLASPVEIRQILTNLLVNAAEATSVGQQITISTLIKHTSVQLRVIDEGIGIPPEHRDRLFQLNFSTKGRGSDSGIGLYIIETIMQQLGGAIGVASATQAEDGGLQTWSTGIDETDLPHWEHSGTCFQLTFPLADALQQ